MRCGGYLQCGLTARLLAAAQLLGQEPPSIGKQNNEEHLSAGSFDCCLESKRVLRKRLYRKCVALDRADLDVIKI
jgi:hypothetical protein